MCRALGDVRFLVEQDADVNAQDSDGWTPLHCAASCNNLPMVKFLVERGGCIFATTLSDHETPAHKCEEEEDGFANCSEYLIQVQDGIGKDQNDGRVHAAYDYDAQNSDEISFRDGDRLQVQSRDDEEKFWWWCVNSRTGQEGYAPRNYLALHLRVRAQKLQKLEIFEICDDKMKTVGGKFEKIVNSDQNGGSSGEERNLQRGFVTEIACE